MENNEPFVDYYSILQVNPECNARTLEVAYRYLAKIYHPDHPETADIDQFNSVIAAYRFLRNANNRLNYNVQYSLSTGFSFEATRSERSEEKDALTDANIHAKLLMFLYKKRREFPNSPGAGVYDILRNINCPDDNFEFHTWYLMKKGFIDRTEDGTFAITVEGVDHVISMSQNTAERQLRITSSDESDTDTQPEFQQRKPRRAGVSGTA